MQHKPPGPDYTARHKTSLPQTDIRIGITQDTTFGFYYPDDLEAFRQAGAELITVDTLNDAQLPKIDGLFIGGGFPETQMQALEANVSLRNKIRQAIEAGLPVYAECGGLMYLTRSLTWKGKTAKMVGALPADAIMHQHPQGRGYVQLNETQAMPWSTTINSINKPSTNAHEFHYSSLENLENNLKFAYRVLRGHGINGKDDGIIYRNVFASYAHLRDVQDNHWVARFVEFTRQCRKRSAP